MSEFLEIYNQRKKEKEKKREETLKKLSEKYNIDVNTSQTSADIFCGLTESLYEYSKKFDVNNKEKKLCSPEKEKEMEILGLEEWQKDLVREGRYEVWSFKSKASGEVSEGSYYKDDTW